MHEDEDAPMEDVSYECHSQQKAVPEDESARRLFSPSVMARLRVFQLWMIEDVTGAKERAHFVVSECFTSYAKDHDGRLPNLYYRFDPRDL